MATNEVGVIKYTVSVDSKGLVTGIKSANGEVKGLTAEMETSSGVATKLGSLVAKIGVATAIAGATTAVIKFGKTVVGAYSDYEQLYGGTRSIFHDQEEYISQVSELAQNAWKDLTVSQNDYYNAFNSTYPLIKNDIEDVNEAIKYTNKLMTLESDLANTFGYDMEYAATAINWALKGTYSYLDNLNIGIKGTKEGFLEAAQACGYVVDSVDELTSAQKLDVIEQYADKYGVLGKTAEEASKTIAGSTKMLKASWENLKLALGTGEGLDEAFANFQEAFTNVIGNIQPVLERIKENLPQFIEGLEQILPQIVELLTPVLTVIVDSLGELLSGLITELTPVLAPALAKLGIAVGGALLKAFVDTIIGIFDKVAEVSSQAGVDFRHWIDGVAQGVVEVIANVAGKISEKVNFIKDIFKGALDTIKQWWENLKNTIGTIATNIGSAISGAIKGAVNGVLNFVGGIVNSVIGGINGAISVINAIPGVSIGSIPSLSIPQLATGGIVGSSNGGSLIVAGEGGEDEWVVPESKMSSLIDQINERTSASQPLTINVYGTFATSDEEQRRVAEQIYDKLQELNKSRLGAYL